MKPIYGFVLYLALGLWLLVSPYTLGFAHTPEAYWNALIVGLIAALSAGAGVYLYWDGGAKAPLSHSQKA